MKNFIHKRKKSFTEKKQYNLIKLVCALSQESDFDKMISYAKPVWMDKRKTNEVIEYDLLVDDFGKSVISNWSF